MATVLFIVGAVVILISVITGFLSGSFMSFMTLVAGGFISALIFFALAVIIENQESIKGKLDLQYEAFRKSQKYEKKTCSKCGREYDYDINSCPNCGNRD
jgi:Oxygen-sensitive ribonucleoside-triphosphate reductase